jgi:hypothetical protein
VGEDERRHIVQAFAECGQFGLERLPVSRQPGVDDRDAVLVDNQVAVDDLGADAGQAAGNLHDTLVPEVSCERWFCRRTVDVAALVDAASVFGRVEAVSR